MLFKGKVAKVVSSVDCILTTQLIFSGRLKDLLDPEILAIFSVLINNMKPGKNHPMLISKISDKFWDACIYLEKECGSLIQVEAQNGVTGEE